MNPTKAYNALLAQKTINELKNRNIEGFYFETKEEALQKAINMVPRKSTVSWSGSQTLKEAGLLSALKSGEYNILDASDRSKGAEEMNRIAHQSLNSDYYFLSANAIAATGEIVNLDGIGNRVAALAYGPKNVIILAGINKVEQNLELAINRAKTKASPLVILSYSKNMVASFNELISKAQDIISQMVITYRSVIKDRIKVILIGEDLGF
ncbi:MAG TPA: lactate utilization protein [Bacteroidales bacterium]|nr:lactate utilization protein [Bacteroidales bacterium]